MPSSSNLNTRVFSPYVVLKQDSSRLAFTIKAGEGYTLNSGITTGSVIRFDPSITATGITGGYTLSRANTDVNSEVVGVVESISGGAYTVVASGSINYPADKLNQITSGGNGGIDVLFLSDTVDGGLTGTIDVSSGQEKIVKPVIQVAKHGNYNGIVTNYIGYKTGTEITAQSDDSLIPLGSVVLSNPSFKVTSNDKWKSSNSIITYDSTDSDNLRLFSATSTRMNTQPDTTEVISSRINIKPQHQSEIDTWVNEILSKRITTEKNFIAFRIWVLDSSDQPLTGFEKTEFTSTSNYTPGGSSFVMDTNGYKPIFRSYQDGNATLGKYITRTTGLLNATARSNGYKVILRATADANQGYSDGRYDNYSNPGDGYSYIYGTGNLQLAPLVLAYGTDSKISSIDTLSFTIKELGKPPIITTTDGSSHFLTNQDGSNFDTFIKVKNDSFTYRIPEDVTIRSINTDSITVGTTLGFKLTSSTGTKTINIDTLCSSCGCCT